MLDETIQSQLIQIGRQFMQYSWDDEFGEFESDQDLKKPQPPLVKSRMRPEKEAISLPLNFDELNLRENLTQLLLERRSHRVFTQEDLSLLQLSYLLWATQGIQEIRGRSYATLRTVPSGGARHGFETYLILQHVQGLKPGRYHYLPMSHQLEYLGDLPDPDAISRSLCGQSWAEKASVIFYWSFVPYRCEWRYGIYAHRTALIDAGHVGQNLYLACTALHLCTCAIAAFDGPYCGSLFELNLDEEFIVYSAPVGTIKASDQAAEQNFYRFVQEQGL